MMRNRKGQPIEGVCIVCGEIIEKRLGFPFRLMKCPKCKLYTVVRKERGINYFDKKRIKNANNPNTQNR